MSALLGKRVLVVEDDFLIAQMVVDIFDEAGATVVGPAGTRESGLALAITETFDAAVLDINLRGERSDDIAAELQQRGIPFVVASGYGEHARMPGIPVVTKPYTPEHLLNALGEVLARGEQTRRTSKR